MALTQSLQPTYRTTASIDGWTSFSRQTNAFIASKTEYSRTTPQVLSQLITAFNIDAAN